MVLTHVSFLATMGRLTLAVPIPTPALRPRLAGPRSIGEARLKGVSARPLRTPSLPSRRRIEAHTPLA